MNNNSGLQLVLGWFGFFSVLTAALGVLPLRSGRHTSDGLLLRTLLRSKEGTKQMIATYAIDMLRKRKIDQIQWNPRWIQAACANTEIQQTTCYADWNAYQTAMDLHAATAAQHLELCLVGSGLLDLENRDLLILEATVFTAWCRNDADKADVWFRRVVRPEQIQPLFRIRAELALHYAHKQFKEAMGKWEEGFALIQRLPQTRVDQYASSWLKWREQIEQRKNEATPVKQAASP